jgi:tetraprenyl-beta-curcumene synthase
MQLTSPTAASPAAEQARSGLGDRRFTARATLALGLANIRYWSMVAPVVHHELRRWERRAQAIEDPELRALALGKLRGESFHAEAAAMLATLAPRPHRKDVVRAIVALELLFDYLDGLTERPSANPLHDGQRLFAAYVDAVTVGGSGDGSESGLRPEHRARDERPRAIDGSYLWALSEAVSDALARLPATPAIAQVAGASATRSMQAQTRMHATPALGTAQLEVWARGAAAATDLDWRELLAGAASSVLAVHALIAAAADPRTTPGEARAIEAAYRSTCVLLTLLDGLVDYDEDTRAGAASRAGGLGYLGLYEDRDELSQVLSDAARRAASQARELRNAPHHAMLLVGVVAYYTSAPGARGELAAPIAKRLRHQLSPLILPTLALMRIWRLAKRIRSELAEPASAVARRASILTEGMRKRGGCNEG